MSDNIHDAIFNFKNRRDLDLNGDVAWHLFHLSLREFFVDDDEGLAVDNFNPSVDFVKEKLAEDAERRQKMPRRIAIIIVFSVGVISLFTGTGFAFAGKWWPHFAICAIIYIVSGFLFALVTDGWEKF